MVTQVEIARQTGLDVSTVNKILNRREGPVFKKDTIRQVWKTARELGFDFGRLKHAHRRRHERSASDMEVRVAVHLADGRLVEEGTAVLRDLSEGGARLAGLSLPSGTLPVIPFELRLRWTRGSTPVEARAAVLRLWTQEGGLGVAFATPPRKAEAASPKTRSGR